MQFVITVLNQYVILIASRISLYCLEVCFDVKDYFINYFANQKCCTFKFFVYKYRKQC